MSIPDLPVGVPATELNQLANTVHEVSLRLLRQVRVVDGTSGLSGPRISPLSVLVFAGPLPIGKLARIEQISGPAITKLVDGLALDGFVRRGPLEDRPPGRPGRSHPGRGESDSRKGACSAGRRCGSRSWSTRPKGSSQGPGGLRGVVRTPAPRSGRRLAGQGCLLTFLKVTFYLGKMMIFSPTPSKAVTASADLAPCLRLAVARLQRIVRQQAMGGLNLAEGSCLAIIDLHGPLSLSDVASRENLSAPTITKIVTRLENQGLIERLARSHRSPGEPGRSVEEGGRPPGTAPKQPHRLPPPQAQRVERLRSEPSARRVWPVLKALATEHTENQTP